MTTKTTKKPPTKKPLRVGDKVVVAMPRSGGRQNGRHVLARIVSINDTFFETSNGIKWTTSKGLGYRSELYSGTRSARSRNDKAIEKAGFVMSMQFCVGDSAAAPPMRVLHPTPELLRCVEVTSIRQTLRRIHDFIGNVLPELARSMSLREAREMEKMLLDRPARKPRRGKALSHYGRWPWFDTTRRDN